MLHQKKVVFICKRSIETFAQDKIETVSHRCRQMFLTLKSNVIVQEREVG